ncbi:histidine kinase, partial [Streptococcus pyogenes]
DLEEVLGNLLENAMKWANGAARVTVRPLATGGEGGEPFEILIEDDGPGIPEDKARDALQRGKRLDETKPGTGLGLAIVADLVNEYGGSLALERSDLGGLKAIVRLRSVR